MLSGKIVKLNMRGIDRNRKGQIMRVLGNILWIILGGLAIAIGWAVVRLVLCISSVACSDSSPQRGEPEKHLLFGDVEFKFDDIAVLHHVVAAFLT